MQEGELSGLPTFTSRVVVEGVERPHSSWSVSRELSGDLPESVAMVAGVTAATGQVKWARSASVSDRPLTPFGVPSGWIPASGDRVVIWEGDGNSEWRVFTGVIDSTTGDASDDPTSKIISDVDRLSRPFSHEPLQRVMPPRGRAESAYIGVGLTHLYFVDAALRNAGFHALPPAEGRQAVSVPAQSSMWPEAGTMTAGTVSGVAGGDAPWAVTHDGPDGASIANVRASYSPRAQLAYGEPVRLSMTVAPDHNGTASIVGDWEGTRVSLAVAGSRTVVARFNGAEVCRVIMGSAVRVSLHVDGGEWELRTNTGDSSTGSVSTTSGSQTLSDVTISADQNSRVAGFHVCYTSGSTRWLYTDFVPTAYYDLSDMSLRGIMDAAPSITESTSKSLLEEISAATMSAMWIDEHGVFQWAPSRALTSRAVARTLTTADDILSMPWRDDLLAARKSVLVRHRAPACTRSRWDNVLWHQGGIVNLEEGQVNNDFLSPQNDSDWVGQMAPVLQLGEPGSAGPASNGWGSLVGGMLATGDTDTSATMLAVSVSPVATQTWKIRHTVGSVPDGSKVELRFPRHSTTIWPRWHGKDLPIIRGFAKTDWVDVETTSSSEWSGPEWAPVLEHDLGPWINVEDDSDGVNNLVVQRLADALAVQTRAPAPVVTGMEVWPDPRLQLGDVIEVQSAIYLGTVFTAMVTGVENSHDGTAAQSLQVRILAIRSTFQTYESWSEQHEGTLTYSQWAALTAQTYQHFAGSED